MHFLLINLVYFLANEINYFPQFCIKIQIQQMSIKWFRRLLKINRFCMWLYALFLGIAKIAFLQEYREDKIYFSPARSSTYYVLRVLCAQERFWLSK